MSSLSTEKEPEMGLPDRQASSEHDVASTGDATVAENVDDNQKAPDGGLQAWLCAVGAFCVFFAGLGFVNSNGIFIEYYLSHQLSHRSADDVAWIGSLGNFIQFGSGIIGGPLFDRYGAWTIRPAAVIYLLSVMLTSLCKEYWQFMLAQGLLMGIGMGGLMFPTIGAIAQAFDKKRASALGLAIAGSSIGGIVIPIAASKMLNDTDLGFGWSVRIIGFIMLLPLAIAVLTVRSFLPPKKTTMFIGAAFKVPAFNWLAFSLFLMFLGVFTPLFFIPTYAVAQGMSPTLASYLLAIINAASTFGRVIPGIMADKLGAINVLAVAAFVSGVIICCITETSSNASLIVYSVFIGFASGTVVSGGTAAISKTAKDPRDMGTYMGMAMALASFAVLIGPPVNGRLLDHYGYLSLALFSGIACIGGGLSALVAKYYTLGSLIGKA